MAALPPSPCCYSGVQSEGTARHKDEIIDGKPAYISPAWGDHLHPDCGIIYLSDVSGIWHNTRLLADQFAYCGYLTVIANYNGQVRQEGQEREDTIQTHSGSDANARRYIKATLDYLRSKGCTKIGAAGYCRGAKEVLKLLATGEVLAGYIAHPAGTSPQDVKDITKPLSIAAAEKDHIFKKQHRDITEEILKTSGVPWQINLYSNVRHGFAVRRAVDTKEEVYGKKQAFIQAACWFEEHLVNGL